jgi:hypothetical protein
MGADARDAAFPDNSCRFSQARASGGFERLTRFAGSATLAASHRWKQPSQNLCEAPVTYNCSGPVGDSYRYNFMRRH